MLIILFILLFTTTRGYELKQVFVLSRHNIRTPWITSMEFITQKKWPAWFGNPGDLTPKGRQMERSMGKYFSDWLIKENLFDDNCPKDGVFVYANTKHRTKETAKSFVEGAFGNCVGVYFKNITGSDPVFQTVVRNTSAKFNETVSKDIQIELNKSDLKNAFLELNKILDIRNSSYCKVNSMCDLSEGDNAVVLESNKEPDILGPLRFAFGAVDSFLMAYYDGMAPENVGWGQIQTTQQWEILLKIINTVQTLRCAIKNLDKDVASTMLEYITNIFQNGKLKLYLLVGHDSNIMSLMSSLRFKDYVLREQFEKAPIGGKVVFQKWYDEENNRDLLRVNYVYQSMKQIRDGAEVNLQNLPLWEILEMDDCTVDGNGFCLWSEFINNLNKIVKHTL